MSIELGDIAKDKVSGLTGLVTAKANYLNGCIRILIEPQKLTKEGKPFEGYWFDQNQVLIVKMAHQAKQPYHGGPMRSVPREHDPK